MKQHTVIKLISSWRKSCAHLLAVSCFGSFQQFFNAFFYLETSNMNSSDLFTSYVKTQLLLIIYRNINSRPPWPVHIKEHPNMDKWLQENRSCTLQSLQNTHRGHQVKQIERGKPREPIFNAAVLCGGAAVVNDPCSSDGVWLLLEGSRGELAIRPGPPSGHSAPCVYTLQQSYRPWNSHSPV